MEGTKLDVNTSHIDSAGAVNPISRKSDRVEPMLILVKWYMKKKQPETRKAHTPKIVDLIAHRRHVH